jgi:hypothetical protein
MAAATEAEVSLMLVRLPRKLGREARPEKLGSNPNPYGDQSNYYATQQLDHHEQS